MGWGLRCACVHSILALDTFGGYFPVKTRPNLEEDKGQFLPHPEREIIAFLIAYSRLACLLEHFAMIMHPSRGGAGGRRGRKGKQVTQAWSPVDLAVYVEGGG